MYTCCLKCWRPNSRVRWCRKPSTRAPRRNPDSRSKRLSLVSNFKLTMIIRMIIVNGNQLNLEQSCLNTSVQWRSEEHTSELQSLMRISYAVFCLNKQKVKYEK